MTLRLNGSTSGYTEIDAPAVAGNNNLKLPTGNGSNGNILGTDGAGNLSWVNGRMVLETAKASTSGTVVDFTGIPSWVKRVTVMFNGVSVSGTANILVQIGSGSVSTSGYASNGAYSGATNQAGAVTSTAGFVVFGGTASNVATGTLSICLLTATTYISSHVTAMTQGASLYSLHGGGTSPSLSGTLDRVRITTVNGTDTFDAGSINILYEG